MQMHTLECNSTEGDVVSLLLSICSFFPAAPRSGAVEVFSCHVTICVSRLEGYTIAVACACVGICEYVFIYGLCCFFFIIYILAHLYVSKEHRFLMWNVVFRFPPLHSTCSTLAQHKKFCQWEVIASRQTVGSSTNHFMLVKLLFKIRFEIRSMILWSIILNIEYSTRPTPSSI